MDIITTLKPYIIWLHANPEWAGVLTFLVCFTECLAMFGLLIPGTVAMTAIGALIGAGILPFGSITLYAIAGAILGDAFSFWLGFRYHGGIQKFWFLRRHPNIIKTGEQFFLRHGGKSIFLGRFVGPVRPILPVVAGMMLMSPLRFFMADIPSAIIWAPTYMLPGFLLGYASQELPPELATRLITLVVSALLIFWCISWLLKRLYTWCHEAIYRFFFSLWQTIRTKTSFTWLKNLLLNPRYPTEPDQLVLALFSIFSILAFGFLTISVWHHGVLTEWNKPVYYFMRSLRNDFLDQVMVGFSLFSAEVMTVMWAAILFWLMVRRCWWAAIHWFLVGALCDGLGELIKHVVHSPRPPGLLETPSGWSYPSGHSLASVMIPGYLAFLLTYQRTRIAKVIAYGAVALFSLCIIFSRLYLGAHWLTDVVGAILLGLSVIAWLVISYRHRLTAPLSPWGMIIVMLVTLSSVWFWSYHKNYVIDLQNYTPVWTVEQVDSADWWAKADQYDPIYRTNRFGKPIEVINVQWAGDLEAITTALQNAGWNRVPKASLISVLSQFAGKEGSHPLPFANQFYQARKPVLVMFKTMGDDKKVVIILRLWDAHFVTDKGHALWLGTVSYHHSWHPFFNGSSRSKEAESLFQPIQVLQKDLRGSFQSKEIAYPPSAGWDGHVLIIRTR